MRNETVAEKSTSGISVIIPTMNRKDVVLSCLESICAQTYACYEVIVVDNASVDGTVEAIERRFPFVRIVRSKHNLGAAGGRNAGMRVACYDYFCFVDSDVTLEKTCLEKLVGLFVGRRARDRNGKTHNLPVGVVGPRIFYKTKPDAGYFVSATINHRSSRTRYCRDLPSGAAPSSGVIETHHIPCVWMMSRQVVLTIGMMDERYGTYYEESDWHTRARLAGYAVLTVVNAIAFHDVGLLRSVKEVIDNQSDSRNGASVLRNLARNRILYMRKFSKPFDFIFFLVFWNPLFALAYIGSCMRHRNYRNGITYLQGLVDGLRLIPSVKPIRTKEALIPPSPQQLQDVKGQLGKIN